MTTYFRPVDDHNVHACLGCLMSMQENFSRPCHSLTQTKASKGSLPNLLLVSC